MVEILFTATHWNKLITAWELEHNQTGTHKLTSLVSMVTPGTTGNVLTSDGTTWTSAAASGGGGTAFWTTVPGTPTRVSDTQFTITDTANANLYDQILKRGVVLKWDESGTFQTAMIISSSYAANTVTVNLVGDSLTAGFTLMKYSIPTALSETYIIPGTLPSAATTNISKTWYAPEDIYVISSDLRLATAGASTGSTIVDINDDGATLFTTKPTITTTGTSDLDNVSTAPATAVAKDSAITVDVDSITATAPADAYVTIWYILKSWRYRT